MAPDRGWEYEEVISGAPKAEASSIIWSEIDFERDCFTVGEGEKGTKNRDVRTVPLFPAARALLERIREESSPGAERSGISQCCRGSAGSLWPIGQSPIQLAGFQIVAIQGRLSLCRNFRSRRSVAG